MTCGIATLDRLWIDADAPSIAPTDRDAVAAVQSLLLGHGFSRMPTILARDCGIYGPQTIAALQSFQSDQNLAATGGIDRGTLQALAKVPARSPVVSERALAFMLDVANQFGDNGAQSVVSTVMKTLKAGASEGDFLAAVGGETVVRVARQYGASSNEAQSTSNRREVMRTTPWLADTAAVFS